MSKFSSVTEAFVQAEKEQGIDPKEVKPSFRSLANSIKSSYLALDPFRKLNRRMVEAYVGPSYGANNKKMPKYMNKVRQTVTAYMVTLGGNRPTVLVSTDHLELRPFAKHYEVNLNNLLKEIEVEETIRQWIFDAFMCVGITKLFLADSGIVRQEGDIAMDPGSPFADNVMLDDWVFDIRASKGRKTKYQGDMYQISVADLQAGVEEGMYDKKVASMLTPDRERTGDESRVDSLISSGESTKNDFSPEIDLADIWVPGDNMVYTFPVRQRSSFEITPTPISQFKWTGPESGPYPLLCFDQVSGQVMPTSPAADIEPLDRLLNLIYNKQANKAKRHKTILAYSPGGEGDAKEARKAHDGELVCMDNPEDVIPKVIGNVDPSLQAFLQDSLGFLDNQAGNITAKLGLGAQTDTLGQEELIHGATSRHDGALQYRVVAATNRLISGLGLLMWQDEFKEIASTIPIAGTRNKFVQSNWEPGDREGNFVQYNFEVAADSMPYQSPSQRVQTINGLLQQIYIPLQDQIREQGGEIDYAELTDIFADLLNIPRLKRIIKFANQVPDNNPGPQVATSKPANTTRTTVRRSVSAGPTQNGERVQSSQNWTGVASNEGSNGAPAQASY
jgi:hypothetical protein